MRLVSRNGKITFLRRRWRHGSALLVGGAMAVGACVVELRYSPDSLLELASVEKETLATGSRRLFYPDDYIIGRWTEGGQETFERVEVPDIRYPNQNVTVSEYAGLYRNAPIGRKFGIIVHIIGIMYMLAGLNTVCDIYFCGALDEMVERWEVQEDVAGATFMAAGGSAPELFTSLIGAIGTESDVGFSTIVGSAVFNVLAVIGACGMAAQDPIKLTWWPLFRDCTYYIFSLCLLAVFAMGKNYQGEDVGPDGQMCDPNDMKKKCGGGKIKLYEAIILFIMYLFYCLIMYNNEKIEGCVTALSDRFFGTGASESKVFPVGNGTDSDEKPTGDTQPSDGMDRTPSDPPECNGDSSAAIEGYHMRRVHHNNLVPYNAQRRSTASSIRSNFRKSATIADGCIGRMQVTTVDLRSQQVERRAEVKCKNGMEDEDDEEDEEHKEPQEPAEQQGPEDGVEKKEEAEEEEDDINALMEMPEEVKDRVIWVFCLPVYAPMYFMIPRPDRCFLATFSISLIFIAFYSYWLVYCVQMFADAILGGGPGVEVIMGFTLLAAGTSIPDLVSSMAVARNGKGDMAISSSIGSNIFDILVGLPIPWILKIGVIEMGVRGNSDFGVSVNSPYIPFYVFLLLFMVSCVVCCILISRWELNKALGIMMSILYCLFLLIVIPLELFQYI